MMMMMCIFKLLTSRNMCFTTLHSAMPEISCVIFNFTNVTRALFVYIESSSHWQYILLMYRIHYKLITNILFNKSPDYVLKCLKRLKTFNTVLLKCVKNVLILYNLSKQCLIFSIQYDALRI